VVRFLQTFVRSRTRYLLSLKTIVICYAFVYPGFGLDMSAFASGGSEGLPW
jgi:hypothetical protein